MGLLVLLSLGTSCRTMPALPRVDLSAPGWRVQQGQAVWKPDRKRPELAGELLLATRANGDSFVQFSKPPFALATAESAGDRWQIEFGAGEYSRCGTGRQPGRFVWFQLPAALLGASVGRDWRFERIESNSWRLGNRRTGEKLEGTFYP
jgi:hypothetical protein